MRRFGLRRLAGRGRPSAAPDAPQLELPFRDRDEAGALLARRLATVELPPGGLVLAIPRGGVPVAAAVAAALGLELDVVVAHKLGAPRNPELAVGAVTADGATFVEPWAGEVGADKAYLEAERERQLAHARERAARLRTGRAPSSLAGRPVIIVDDGIATGSTMRAAILTARSAGAAPIIVAVPVAAAETLSRLEGEADQLVALSAPEPFFAVGQWYERFDQVSDQEVGRLLADAARRMEGPARG